MCCNGMAVMDRMVEGGNVRERNGSIGLQSKVTDGIVKEGTGVQWIVLHVTL